MYTKNIILSAITTAVFCASSEAAVTLVVQGGNLRDNAGLGITNGSQVALFADNDGNSIFPTSSQLLGQTLTVGQSYGGNELIGLFSATSGITGGAGGFNGSINFDLDGGLAENTRLSVFWFAGHTSGAIQAGQSYGAFQSTTIPSGSGGNQALQLPANGANRDIFYFDPTVVANGGATIADFTANLTVVPEPSSTALLGLGSVALLLRRRR